MVSAIDFYSIKGLQDHDEFNAVQFLKGAASGLCWKKEI